MSPSRLSQLEERRQGAADVWSTGPSLRNTNRKWVCVGLVLRRLLGLNLKGSCAMAAEGGDKRRELTCPTAYRGDRLYISLQIGVFYDNHLHGNQVSRH